ncbi:hypothetical protein FRC02_004582 [Tulasnella sp. 418]|nr:hypothetical protein FRC02_004582 [Tulasnella sp. 418]
MANEQIKSLSLSSLLAKESRLLKLASEAIPHSFNTCTYDEPGGYIRQAVYLCKTCTADDGTPGKGICAACSVSCHAEHEQLELFPKRNFRCDCPTAAIPVPCTLHKSIPGGSKEPPNTDNAYGQNFLGKFCRCGRDYDPTTETETMIQCLACEDWWHESCLHLKGRLVPKSAKSSPTKPRASSPPTAPTEPSSEAEIDGIYDEEMDDDDDEEDATLSLIPSSTYDALICGKCVSEIPVLHRWAGTPGARMIIKRRTSLPHVTPGKVDFGGWTVWGEKIETKDEGDIFDVKKRSSSPPSVDASEPPSKKMRTEAGPSVAKVSSCKAPPQDETAQIVLRGVDKRLEGSPSLYSSETSSEDEIIGEGDIFLSEGWRDRWCRCPDCLPLFDKYPYLLEEEETFTPPDDPDSNKSLEELGLRALQTLPRDKALDSIRAFNEMRDDLMNYLRPFAEQGKVVSSNDINEFFEMRKAARSA